jgi:glutamate-5-semialdehyde dehydrogenase
MSMTMVPGTEDTPHLVGPLAAPAVAPQPPLDEAEAFRVVAERARRASFDLSVLPRAAKDAALLAMADALIAATDRIVAANATDLARGRAGGMAAGLLDRLTLDEPRIAAIADGLR